MTKGYRSPLYGRTLDEFEIGATYEHPWEVTVDVGHLALAAGSFLDASPVFASARSRAARNGEICVCEHALGAA